MRFHGVLAFAPMLVSCAPDAVGADGTGSSSSDSSASGTFGTGASASASTATTATSADASTSATTDEGSCPIGSAGCPCTGGGACDANLTCVDGTCVEIGDTTGSASTVSGSTESSSTGISDACGNGLIDPGEVCDDGDAIQGNGCNNDCVESGTELWTIGYDGPDGLDDWARGVAVFSDDSFVVTGTRSPAGAGHDIITRKYDGDGNLIWERTYNGAADVHDEGFGVAVDSDDNVFVAAYVHEIAGNTESWLRKYDSDGAPLWTATYQGTVEAGGYDVAVDQVGDPVIVGYASAAGEGYNTFVRKYTADGDVAWTVLEDQGLGDFDTSHGVRTDGADNVIVVGNDASPQGWARGYDADGSLLWTQAPDDTTDLWGVDFDAGGDPFVVGNGGTNEARLHHLDSDGGVLTSLGYAPGGGAAWAYDVAVDSTDAVVVCGSDYTGTDLRLFVRKYGANGSAFWTDTYTGVVSDIVAEEAWSCAVDSEDNIIVVGYEQVAGQYDWWIRKYTP